MILNHLRVLFLNEFFYPFDRGGTEWSVHHLAAEMINRGNKIMVFTPNFGSVTASEKSKFVVYRFPYYLKLYHKYDAVSPLHFSHPGWWIWTIYCLGKLVRQQKPQVIHVQGKYFIPQAVIIGKLFKIPVVVTLRDYSVLCPHAYCLRRENGYRACNLFELLTRDTPKYFRNFKINGIKRWGVVVGTVYAWLVSRILRFFLTKVEATVSISFKLQQIYSRNNVNISTTIYNTFKPQNIKHKRSGPYILYVGRLTEGKGLPLLLKTYDTLELKKLPKLVIVGDKGKDITPRQKNVEFTGHLSYSQTLKYITNALLVVVPALWEEPFGRVALESIIQGTPVVVSSRGGLPEIVIHGVSGVVVEPNIQELARGILYGLRHNKRLRRNLRTLLPRLLKRFYVEPVNRYERLYRSMI